MSELKIVPTELQLINAFTNKPPGVIFKLIKQVGLIPNKKNMLALLMDFAEHSMGVPDLLRALRRAGIDVISDEEMIFAFQQRLAHFISHLYLNFALQFIKCFSLHLY